MRDKKVNIEMNRPVNDEKEKKKMVFLDLLLFSRKSLKNTLKFSKVPQINSNLELFIKKSLQLSIPVLRIFPE